MNATKINSTKITLKKKNLCAKSLCKKEQMTYGGNKMRLLSDFDNKENIAKCLKHTRKENMRQGFYIQQN